MNIEFLPLAKLELDNAIEYYELQLEGLGKRYKEEVRTSIKRISIFPQAWSLICPNIRKCVMHKFPYKFCIQFMTILIIAVAHHHREPDYWVEK